MEAFKKLIMEAFGLNYCNSRTPAAPRLCKSLLDFSAYPMVWEGFGSVKPEMHFRHFQYLRVCRYLLFKDEWDAL